MDYLHFDKNGKLATVFTYPDDEYIPLQYTGRKDKYKKEIYEGNIIVEYDDLGRKPPLEVYWDETMCSFRCRHGVYNGPLPESKYIEVIGNIDENPELLEKE